MVDNRSAGMPRLTRYSFAACARLAPSARLYSLVPRSSQWPSISTRADGLAFSQSALVFNVARASGRKSKLSNAKKTSLSGLEGGVSVDLPSPARLRLESPVAASPVLDWGWPFPP